jgi:hypothetical protein
MARTLIRVIIVLALACFAMANVSHAGGNEPRAGTLSGDIAIDYTLLADGSLWKHVYTIDTMNPTTGEFSGTGHYVPDACYVEIITGRLVGAEITFHILYVGSNSGYTVDAVGTLDDNGQLSGTAASPGQAFTWTGSRAHPLFPEKQPVACDDEPPAWTLAGDYAIDYTLLADGSLWKHLYTIDTMNASTGEFSGTGHGVPDASYVEIITGRLVGKDISFHILYVGTNAGYTADAVGTIDDSGQLSGTATSPGQSLAWIGARAAAIQGPQP